jgi:hypothetical protein
LVVGVTVETTQRWRLGRDSHRARAADFRPGDYGVELLADDTRPRAFIEAHHYSGSYPAARCRVGLFRRLPFAAPELVGVAVYSVGVQPKAPAKWSGLAAAICPDLGRLVLLDDVPYCAETWILARAFAVLRGELPGVAVVLSYSDPLPRVTDAGHVVMPVPCGRDFTALAAVYDPDVVIDPTGRVDHRRRRQQRRHVAAARGREAAAELDRGVGEQAVEAGADGRRQRRAVGGRSGGGRGGDHRRVPLQHRRRRPRRCDARRADDAAVGSLSVRGDGKR